MSAAGEFCWKWERYMHRDNGKHKTCGFTFLVWRVSNPIFLLQCEVSINQKILWNDGLIETLTSEHRSACKRLGQCGKVSGVYRRKVLLDVSVKKKAWILEWTMELPTMNNGNAGRQWSECPMVNELGQYLSTRQQTTQSVKIAVCEFRAVLPAL